MAPPPAKKAKTTPTQISGDSLEEDFVLEDDFAPLSGDERDEGQAVASPDAAAAAELHDDPDDVHRPLPASDDEEGEAGAATTSKEKKRKAGASEGGAGEGQPASKKKGKDKKVKDNSKVKEKKQLRVELDIAQAEGMGLLPPAPLADRLAEKQKKALPKVSEMELDDIRLPESYLVDTCATTSRSNLEAFIRASFPTLPTTLAKPPKKEGSPRLLVLAGAALRVADLCREVKEFKSEGIEIAKLFAKHFKLAEHVEYLHKTKVCIAVGTPNRIGKLLEEPDALHLTHLSHIILDTTHLDAKKRSMVDMVEAREDLFKNVLGNERIMERLKEGKCKIVVY